MYNTCLLGWITNDKNTPNELSTFMLWHNQKLTISEHSSPNFRLNSSTEISPRSSCSHAVYAWPITAWRIVPHGRPIFVSYSTNTLLWRNLQGVPKTTDHYDQINDLREFYLTFCVNVEHSYRLTLAVFYLLIDIRSYVKLSASILRFSSILYRFTRKILSFTFNRNIVYTLLQKDNEQEHNTLWYKCNSQWINGDTKRQWTRRYLPARNGIGDGMRTPPRSKMTAFVWFTALCLSPAALAVRCSAWWTGTHRCWNMLSWLTTDLSRRAQNIISCSTQQNRTELTRFTVNNINITLDTGWTTQTSRSQDISLVGDCRSLHSVTMGH